MESFPYDALWHYSEKFSRDPDLRQDLVLLAWQPDQRFGEKSEIRLLKNYMKLRAREIEQRSPLGVDISGKSLKDVWSHERVSIFKPIARNNQFCIADTLTSVERNPFSATVVRDFEDALPAVEAHVAEQIVAGYGEKEAMLNLGITSQQFRSARTAVRQKAREYLV